VGFLYGGISTYQYVRTRNIDDIHGCIFLLLLMEPGSSAV